MFGFEYRWLALHPLVRSCLLSLSVAAFCVACLFLRPAVSSATQASALVVAAAAPGANPEAAPDRRASGTRALLRLWLLAPQLLPSSHDR